MTRPHPPRARLAYRVGIVGHRPDRLPDGDTGQVRIRERLESALVAVKAAVEAFHGEADAAFYGDEPPLLRANSPLAEGVDRLFADVAIDLGYLLWCPMPFARAEYEQDFLPGRACEPDSLARFRAIVDRAAAGPGLTTFELDGHRTAESAAYGAAGRLVVNQSDLLIAVWDGGRINGPGGTFDTLTEAIGFNIPVLWIDPRAPHGWALLRGPADLACRRGDAVCSPAWVAAGEAADRDRLREVVAAIVMAELRLPAGAAAEGGEMEASRHARQYFQERKPPINPFLQWKYFRDLIGEGRPRWLPVRVKPFVEQVRTAWPAGPADLPPGAAPPPMPMASFNAALRGHYAWADKRADLYADAHRSTNIITSLFAALAVFLALLPMAMGWSDAQRGLERTTIVFEFLILDVIVLLNAVGHRRRWHTRWLEYRVMAELVRQLRLLLPLGGGRPTPRAAAHLVAYGDPARSWMYWHIRAIARAMAMPSCVVTRDYIGNCLEDLFDIANGPENGQLRFHHASHLRSHRTHARLHAASAFLFWTTIVAVGAHFLLSFLRPENLAGSRWLLLISAVAPALGAALGNINNQGEFGRLAKRSLAMEQGFIGVVGRIEALRRLGAAGPTLAEVTQLARAMTDMMVDENVDWRVVVLDLPHMGG